MLLKHNVFDQILPQSQTNQWYQVKEALKHRQQRLTYENKTQWHHTSHRHVRIQSGVGGEGGPDPPGKSQVIWV